MFFFTHPCIHRNLYHVNEMKSCFYRDCTIKQLTKCFYSKLYLLYPVADECLATIWVHSLIHDYRLKNNILIRHMARWSFFKLITDSIVLILHKTSYIFNIPHALRNYYLRLRSMALMWFVLTNVQWARRNGTRDQIN